MFFRYASAPKYAYTVTALFVVSLSVSPARAGFTSFSIGGTTTAASIQPTVDAFRAALGDPNNGNAAGPLASGRREINWDGGGLATATVTAGTTLSAFTNTRGGTFTTPGTGFLQTPLTDPALTGIQASYATTFAFFSTQRIFTPTGSNITDVTFSLPGSAGATPAAVSGFGAVFSDVDLAGVTKIELFDIANVSLGAFNVPPGVPGAAPSATLSFLGLAANAGEKIGHVRITTGNQPLGLADNGDNVEVVVMDDFIYGEPKAVPEPASASLTLAALGAAAMLRARRLR